jgi:hypothetical protein
MVWTSATASALTPRGFVKARAAFTVGLEHAVEHDAVKT